MPPFNFGQSTGRAFADSFQRAQDRQLQRKRQRALQRFRMQRLAQQADQFQRRMQQQDENQKLRQDELQQQRDQFRATNPRVTLEGENVPYLSDDQDVTTRVPASSLLQMAASVRRGGGQGQGLEQRRQMATVQALQLANRSLASLPTQDPFGNEGMADLDAIRNFRDQTNQAVRSIAQAQSLLPLVPMEQRPLVEKKIQQGLMAVGEATTRFTTGAQSEIKKRGFALAERENESRGGGGPMGMGLRFTETVPVIENPQERTAVATEVNRIAAFRNEFAPVADLYRRTRRAGPQQSRNPRQMAARQLQQTILRALQNQDVADLGIGDLSTLLDETGQVITE